MAEQPLTTIRESADRGAHCRHHALGPRTDGRAREEYEIKNGVFRVDVHDAILTQ
jgi:hypothetical protein